MNTNTQFWLYLAQFFLEWEMFWQDFLRFFQWKEIYSDIIVVVITITTTTSIIAFVCFLVLL